MGQALLGREGLLLTFDQVRDMQNTAPGIHPVFSAFQGKKVVLQSQKNVKLHEIIIVDRVSEVKQAWRRRSSKKLNVLLDVMEKQAILKSKTTYSIA